MKGKGLVLVVILIALTCLLALLLMNPTQVGTQKSQSEIQLSNIYGQLPLQFEPHHGETDTGVKFLSRGAGYNLFLSPTETIIALNRPEEEKGSESAAFEQLRKEHPSTNKRQVAQVKMKLEGANPAAIVEGQNKLPGKTNYLIGNDPTKWRTDVPTYGRVYHHGVYPGIDLAYYGNQRQLESDFIVSPGVDANLIKLSFDGIQGLRVNADGDLLLDTEAGVISQRKPVVYQEVNGARRIVDGAYRISEAREVGFQIGDYDHTLPLVIDPILVYATYLGGGYGDIGRGITVDADGNAYVTGVTLSTDFPTFNALKPALLPAPSTNIVSWDAFVTKLNPTGTAFVFSTYIGGAATSESGSGIALDDDRNIYVVGNVNCNLCAGSNNDFPLVNAFQSTFGGETDAFLLKLDSGGKRLLFSTFFGGNNTDTGLRVAWHRASGDAYVVGYTSSIPFYTTPGAFKTTQSPFGSSDAFITRFTSTGSVRYSTLFGGEVGWEDGTGLAVDVDGNVFVTGTTASPDFPVTPGAYQAICTGCNFWRSDAYVAKLTPNLSSLIYSTHLGGSNDDFGTDVAIDAAGNAYVTGETQSVAPDLVLFPTTPGAFQQTAGKIFVTKLNPTGTALVYSTRLGLGINPGRGFGIEVDSAGNAHVTGQAIGGFNEKNSIESFQDCAVCPFVTKLNAAGSDLIYSTRIGSGSGLDLALDAAGHAYITGEAYTVPTTPGVVQQFKPPMSPYTAQIHDAFVARFGPGDAQYFTISGVLLYAYAPTMVLPGVKVTLSGTQNNVTYTDAAGRYRFVALAPGGNYTVTPSYNGLSFTPPQISFSNLTTHAAGDFTAHSDTPPSCIPYLSSLPHAHPASGGTWNIGITMLNGCSWKAASNESWISIVSGAEGNGTGTVSYSVSPLPKDVSKRTGTLIIAGQPMTVMQIREAVSVSAASYSPNALASETITSAFGTELASSIQAASALPLPTSLAGTTVKLRDSQGVERLAPLFYVSPTQINYLVPAGIATGLAEVTVTTNDGVVSVGEALINTCAGALFAADSTGQGVAAAVALRVKADGSQIYEPIARWDAAQNTFIWLPLDLGPEAEQVFLLLFGTGVRHRSALSDVEVRIGGEIVEMLYAGPQGEFVGLDQINVRVPRSLIGRGTVNIGIKVNGNGLWSNTVGVQIK